MMIEQQQAPQYPQYPPPSQRQQDAVDNSKVQRALLILIAIFTGMTAISTAFIAIAMLKAWMWLHDLGVALSQLGQSFI
jgi:hypothetical protein